MNVNDNDKERIWGEGFLRVFVSHASKHKEVVSDLKSCLHKFGMSAFVAHEDIEPTREWQKEIRRALFSMDILIALLTDDFKNSQWTDQEIGVAVGRKIPIVSIRNGKDPYGFIRDFQAISGADHPSQWANTFFELALKNSDLSSQAVDAFILGVERVTEYSEADHLVKTFLPKIEKLTSTQHSNLLKAFNNNNQVFEAFKYKPFDVPEELCRITGFEHSYTQNGKLDHDVLF